MEGCLPSPTTAMNREHHMFDLVCKLLQIVDFFTSSFYNYFMSGHLHFVSEMCLPKSASISRQSFPALLHLERCVFVVYSFEKTLSVRESMSTSCTPK